MTFIPSWYAAFLHNSTLCTEVNIYTSFYSRRGMEIDLLNKRTRETEFAFKQSNIYIIVVLKHIYFIFQNIYVHKENWNYVVESSEPTQHTSPICQAATIGL